MKRVGIISYNIYCNFTNYGSALQSWALYVSIKKLGFDVKLVDYCPDVLKDKNPLNPFKNSWDQSDEAKLMCELTMPSIKINYEKFIDFYYKRFDVTSKYDSSNFNDSIKEVSSFVCGSDTIFCVDEFGIDDGYYANYDCMKHNSISYAASFGDSHFSDEQFVILNDRLKNFNALGIREDQFINYVKKQVDIPVKRVLDPTLLLEPHEYEPIIGKKQMQKNYILYYSRRYNKKMEDYVEKLSKKTNFKVVEISLRASNAEKGHVMRYDAGVEEFLSLIKNASFVVTNSFHGMIFAVQFKRPFVVFSREQCDNKIQELLDLFGLSDRLLINGDESFKESIDFNLVHKRIDAKRKESIDFLKFELEECL